VFTARYALSTCIKQIRFVFKGLNNNSPACLWRTLRLKTLPDLRNDYVPEGKVQDGIEHTRGQLQSLPLKTGPAFLFPPYKQAGFKSNILYIRTLGSLVETETPTHWNLIGHSMTAPPLESSPSSILPPPSSHYAFVPARKNSLRAWKILPLFYFFKIAQVWNCVTSSYVGRGVCIFFCFWFQAKQQGFTFYWRSSP
jgi:hypothetical protein